MIYTLILERGEESWGGMCPDLPGLLVLGDTREDVVAQAPDAITDYLDALRDLGKPMPHPGELVEQISV